MDLLDLSGYSLRGLASVNVLLGKNGCGKSYLLKRIEETLLRQANIGKVRYVSPERGGVLSYQAGVEQSIMQQPTWLGDARRRNQSANFREQSASLFRRLELMVLREIEREHTQAEYEPRSFDETVDRLNTLLDRVKLERDTGKAFSIKDRQSGAPAQPEDISSGEAELISLGIEFLTFIKEAEPGKENYLFVDEPDVHLHPDLQDRLTKFIAEVLAKSPVTLVLATHSTVILAGLSETTDTRVAFMRRGDRDISFKSVTDVDRAILPIFGAHPLSNIFNQAPVLLIEGEDDERIWQQAVRSSAGHIRLYPCAVGGIGQFSDYENEVSSIIQAVYDEARGYSLRDRDLQPELIEDLGPIVRMRLACREAENLMLSDNVLSDAEIDWPTFQRRLQGWVAANTAHQYYEETRAFAEGGFNRKEHDLKPIRNILVGLMSNKPWEVLVGAAIARLAREKIAGGGPGSLRDFLGEKVCRTLLKLEPA